MDRIETLGGEKYPQKNRGVTLASSLLNVENKTESSKTLS